MLSQSLLIYLVMVGALGIITIKWAGVKLKKIKKLRTRRVKKLDNMQSVDTNAPLELDDDDKEIEQAVEKVEARFTIISKITLIVLIVVWSFALTFPFLGSIPATLLSVLMAVAGAVIGIASKPLVENTIAGIVLSLSKAVRVGDTVFIDGHYGTIEDITLTHTIIKIWNWKRLIIPSHRMLSKEVVNYSYGDSYIWAHVEFYVSYTDDLEKVREIAIKTSQMSSSALYPEPASFWVMNLEKESYHCWLAAWAETPSLAWELASDMRTELILQFQKQGVSAHQFNVDLRGKPSL